MQTVQCRWHADVTAQVCCPETCWPLVDLSGNDAVPQTTQDVESTVHSLLQIVDTVDWRLIMPRSITHPTFCRRPASCVVCLEAIPRARDKYTSSTLQLMNWCIVLLKQVPIFHELVELHTTGNGVGLFT